jgi:hypothetical protein
MGMDMPETITTVRLTWRQRVRALFTQPIKLPGWAAAILAVIIFIPDWHSRIEFWLAVAKATTGYFGLIAAAIASPYFSLTLFVGGLLWVLLIGEPAKGVRRRHWLRYVGWSVFLICLTTVVATAGYGAIEFYIQQQVSARDREIQNRTASRPVYWHLTDAQRTALAFELDKVPEEKRFEVKIKCLPDAGSRTMVDDIGKVLIDHKWKVSANCLFSNIRADLTGFGVSVPKGLKDDGVKFGDFPDHSRKLIEMLQSSNVVFFLAADDLKEDEVFLIVGNAP